MKLVLIGLIGIGLAAIVALCGFLVLKFNEHLIPEDARRAGRQ
jgi:hypothetical protein